MSSWRVRIHAENAYPLRRRRSREAAQVCAVMQSASEQTRFRRRIDRSYLAAARRPSYIEQMGRVGQEAASSILAQHEIDWA